MIKLNIKATNFKLSPAISDHIEEKIGTLDKFVENIDPGLIQGWVEVGLTTKHHQSGDIYRAEAQIQLAGKSSRAEAMSGDIFMAIDAVKDKLQIELKKYKEKKSAIGKKGSRLMKKVLKINPKYSHGRRTK